MAFMTKYLLGGIGLTGLTSTFMFYGGMNGIPSLEKGEISNHVEGEEEEPKTLIEKAGLKCDKGYCWPSWIGRRKFNVEKGEKDENLFFDYWEKGKIRVHTGSEGYPGGLRFTIEGADIPLRSGRSWFKNSILTLEEFENYEIKNDGNKYYFSRTKNSKEGKILELGLPEACVLPETGESTCSIFHVGKVKFEGLEGVVDGETSLTISKTEDKTFRDGYKFTFKFPQDVTIGNKVFRANSPVDFRMKKHGKGGLILELAWANEKDLLNKVGLECGENGDCSLKSGETLKIKKSEKQDFIEISDISPGKIRLYKDDEYFNGLRLQVEEAKITSGNNTLEEFETYEIKEEGDEYYLLRKKTSEERIRELLKYPCSLSSASTECNISNERKLNVIKFEGKGESPLSLQGKTVKITVSKAPEADFPVGWKFTFNFPHDVTIGGKGVKANTPTDFKLKRHDDGSLTLERSWASENDLAGKAGLSCDESGNCSLKPGETLNIKKENRDFPISDLSGGKIKLFKGSAGYSNGLNFTIEGGKIGSGNDVLEEFETYEIKEEGGKYYLVLKTSAEEQMKKLLNFPSRCYVSSECSELNENEFKAINFEGKVEDSISLSGQKVKITVSNASEGDFPFSRKFTVTSPTKITISSSTSISANSPTDFKLKKNGEKFSLERVWTNENILIGKVGLNCGTDGDCSLKNGSIKVRKNGKELEISSLSPGKIKLYKDSDNYSNGLKFAVEDGKIGTGEQILEEFETYEIAGNRNEYYLSLKTSAEEKIKELLGYPSRCSSLSSCDKLNEGEIKKINFSGKDDGSMSLQQGKTVKITVSKAPEGDFPLGRKFKLESGGDLTISNTISVKANVPTEFKIEKGGSGQNTTLSLAKAWTLQTLAQKAGLDCTDKNNCSITSENLNVKKEKDLLKKASRKNDPQTSSAGKIKVMEGQPGYNEGFKFLILDADIKLTSSGGSDNLLEEFESYEIKKHGDDYYLERKTTSLQEKWKTLGLPDKCQSNFDKDAGCKIENNADLGKIKFYGKDASKQVTIPSGGRVFLKTFKTQESGFPLGIKVKMEVKDHNVKIPKPTSGSIILWKDYETEFKVKKEDNDTYSLVNTVNVNELVKQVGITNGNCDDEGGCTIGGKINIYMSGTEYRRDAEVKETTKKITYRMGNMKNMKFSENLVFRVPKGGIELTSYSGMATKFAGRFNKIKEGTYVIKKYTAGSPNNNELVPYLAREYAQNYNIYDKFFNYED